MKKILIIIAVSIFLVGCGTNGLVVKNANLITGETDVNLLIEPYQSVGISKTPSIERGEITTVAGQRFPKILLGEYWPGRIRWNSWTVDGEGYEYFGQAMLAGINYAGYLNDIIVIDGKISKNSDSKGVILSSAVDYAYDLEKGLEIPLDRNKFLVDREYRREIINQHGTSLKKLSRVSNMPELFTHWNKYETPTGILISPLGEEEVKEIAGINPQYSFSEKLVATTHGSISMDWIGSVAKFGIEVITAANGSIPSTGWDYNSQLPSRRHMGLIIDYVSKMEEGIIRKLNDANSKPRKEARK